MLTAVETVTSSPTITSADLLDEAVRVWSVSQSERRDSSIRVGSILCQYVLSRLREADGQSTPRRCELGLTRETIVKDASVRLRVPPVRISEIMRVSKVVEFMGDPKEMSYSSLRAFVVFIHRKKGRVTRNKSANPGVTYLPSETEQWRVVSTRNIPNPIELYKQASEEGWSYERVKAFIRNKIKSHHKNTPSSPTDGRPKVNTSSTRSLGEIARETDPRDLVDMIVEMIQNCPRQELLKRLLTDRIKL